MLFAKLTWFFKRLSVMGPYEVLHRINEQINIRLMKNAVRSGRVNETSLHDPGRFSFYSCKESILPELKWHFDLEAEQRAGRIDELLAGHWPALGFDWKWSLGTNSWHIAPDSGSAKNRWPKDFFNDISFREGNPYGDVRVAWEPARLQQLIKLALLIQVSEDGDVRDSAVDVLQQLLLDWHASNPMMQGIHYISAMECGLRILSVCHAVDLVRGYLSSDSQVWRGVVSLVSSHATFIEKRLSLYSSAGNHTVAEALGLLYAGWLFPELKRAGYWRQRAIELLETEADRQILADGGSAEQAFWYLLFVSDLYGLADNLLRHKGAAVSSVSDAFQRARQFLSSFAAKSDELPRIGDSDDGYALSEYLDISWDASLTLSKQAENQTVFKTFEHSGYSLCSIPSQNLKLVIDHGNLGMEPSYGHGHADALSITLWLNDEPVFIDTGTFRYTGEPAWRRYFRSTLAHNTLLVGSQDQAEQQTAFMWTRPYESRLAYSEQKENGDLLMLAFHSGYEHLGVRHWRGVLCRRSGSILVWDFAQPVGDITGLRKFQLHWHAARSPERIEVVLSNPAEAEGRYRLQYGKKPIYMSVRGGELSIHCGEKSPVLGWQSPRYGCKQASPVLRAELIAAGKCEFVSLITVDVNESLAHYDVDLGRFLKLVYSA